MLATRGRAEHGSALVISIIALSLMLMLGLAALAMTDTQTRESGVERVRESSFNLAEGALQQQSFLLGGKGWPRDVSAALPEMCTATISTNSRCPTPTSLVPATGTGAYTGIDYASGATWSTKVRDNAAVNDRVYVAAIDTPARPRYDANGDGFIWVKSSATVGQRTRTIVALLKRDPIPLAIPKAVLVAGGLSIPQNGQSGVITTTATTPVVLRCDGYGGTCNESNTGKGSSQISPNAVQYSGANQPPFVSADVLAKIIDSATTYTPASTASCPSGAQLSGIVVIAPTSDGVECQISGNTPINSVAAPGILVIRQGTLKYTGNAQFYGLILHLNEGDDGSTTKCVDISGTPNIYGGIVVEGNCGYQMSGNSRLVFSPSMLNFSVTGVAGLVQNTWRELPSS